MPDRVAWADMTDGSPSRGGNSPITVTDLQAARAEVAAAQLAVNAVNILEDRKAYEAVQTVLAERLATFDQISEAVKSNEAAAAAAAAAAETPPPVAPSFREDRPTDRLIQSAVERSSYELRAEIRLLNAKVAELTEGRSTDSPSGKNPPSAPKFNGVKGPGKLTVEAWLLQYVDWCELHNVPAAKRVSYAIQALEGDAVQNWYNLKRGLLAEDKDPHSWVIFRSGMIAGYAEVSPDIYVRTHLSKLRQGAGTVQVYYDKFTAVLSQADRFPVLGAEAVWHFKQGLSERVRTAIAGSSDDNLHAVAVQAKRVDAEFNLHTPLAGISASITAPTKSFPAVAAVAKRGAANTSTTASKRAKTGNPASDPLVAHRLSRGVCTNCGVEKLSHKGVMGTGCTSATVAATYAEQTAMGKGKAKA